jgi:hypothetical protein
MAKVRRISGQVQMTVARNARTGTYNVRMCTVRVRAPLCQTVRVKITPVTSNDPQFEYDRAAAAALRRARPDLADFADPAGGVTRPRGLPRRMRKR